MIMPTSSFKRIAFQGELGAYSHLALKAYFKEIEAAIPCLNFATAMQMVSQGEADAAMIPVENSQWGRVSDVHFLLPETDLRICSEFFHPVQHKLMVLPGTKLEDLTHVMSHPQALGQCAGHIQKLNLTPLPAYDTAGAAQRVATQKLKNHGAIASDLAAELYGLEILKSDFQDAAHNTTRFLIMCHQNNVPDILENISETDTDLVTAFLFKTRHIPAALYKVLGGFATNNINIIRLESYVDPLNFVSSSFYMEVSGHQAQASLQRAFEELRFFTTDFKFLGSFQADSFRQKEV